MSKTPITASFQSQTLIFIVPLPPQFKIQYNDGNNGRKEVRAL